MKRTLAALALAAGLASGAWAGPVEEARALYQRFVVAQNASDFRALEDILLDSAQFLWVSDGQSIWGRDVAIRRMADYHTAEIWRITPDAARTRAVEVNATTAYVHLPLELEIGAAADGPDRFHFLVSALASDTPAGWRIVALFTTMAKRE
jgi:ketosteroid isomerase-like protein